MSPVLGAFDPDVTRARKAYARFVGEALGEGHVSEFYVVQEQQILGSERFAEKISLPRETPSRKQGKIALGFGELLVRVSRATLVPPALITGRSRAESVYRARALLCYVATSVAGLPGRKVADALGRDPSAVSRAVGWAERMTKVEREKLLQRIFGLG